MQHKLMQDNSTLLQMLNISCWVAMLKEIFYYAFSLII